jgi:hypothetical protein
MYVRLFEKLLSENVEFLLLGGAAVCLHGYSRMTTDIDIILQNSRENIGRFLSAVSHWGDGCAVGLSFDDFQGPGCVRIDEDFPLDVFTLLNGKPYEDFVKAAVRHTLTGGVQIRSLSIADLIDLKKNTLREKDTLDVTVLERLQQNPQSTATPSINLQRSSESEEGPS